MTTANPPPSGVVPGKTPAERRDEANERLRAVGLFPPAPDLGTKLREYVSRNVFYGTGVEAADLLIEAAALIDALRVRIGELEKERDEARCTGRLWASWRP
jgi:hypothetical protein